MPEFLPDLPVEGILECLKRSPGNEINSGKFDSPESSAALVANAFGWFLNRAQDLPPLPGVPAGQVASVTLEAEMRFPWTGGRHPWLDVGIETHTTLIGIESKRYEPFRPAKAAGFSDTYDRPEWGEKMAKFTKLRNDLVAGEHGYFALDAVQLIKHAYGIYTRAEKRALGGVLVYLYAEPATWASGKPVDPKRIALHRREVADFSKRVAGDTVSFVPLRWEDLLDQWSKSAKLAAHVGALHDRFGALG
ncbi:MAG: hypothetical protein V4586_06095 [Pseudomonadota bacterium]